MVLNCVAYSCFNLHDKRDAVCFHRFPFKRPEILVLWVKAIRRENWVPSKTSRLCSAHFLPTDYLDIPGNAAKLLKPNAVPSIFAFPKRLIKKIPLQRKTIVKHELKTSISMDVDLPSTSDEGHTKKCIDNGTQTTANNITPSLRRQVKSLKQKISRRDKKISTMKDVIREIKNSGHSNESLNTVLQNYFRVCR